MSELSKYAENQFLSATLDNLALMGEFLADTYPRVALAAATMPVFEPIRGELQSIIAAYDTTESLVTNQEALLPSRTLAFENKLASLTRKPDPDTNSPLETWHLTLAAQAPVGGVTYTYLLPQGRETLTTGTYDQQLDAGRDFGIRVGFTCRAESCAAAAVFRVTRRFACLGLHQTARPSLTFRPTCDPAFA